MKSILLITLSFAIQISAICQQNFFNVPSSDITLNNKFFIQKQVNFLEKGLQSNTTISYGLGKKYEIGINLLELNFTDKKIVFNTTSKPYTPIIALNFQKLLLIKEKIKFSLGSQIGSTKMKNLCLYIYSNNVNYFKKYKTKLVTGLYYTNNDFWGSESRNISEQKLFKKLGIQLGIEQNIWKEKILFQADLISGKHKLGQTVIGGAYCFKNGIILSGGYQLPLFKSLSEKAIVFELTFIPN